MEWARLGDLKKKLFRGNRRKMMRSFKTLDFKSVSLITRSVLETKWEMAVETSRKMRARD